MMTNSAAAERNRRPALTVIDETDGYTSALAGVTAEAVRIGQGIGPNVVLAVPGEPVTVTSIRYGFPMTAGAHIPDDRLLAAYIHDDPTESRWCGVPLRAGSVVLYPPGTDHFAIARAGLRLTYVVTDPESLMTLADRFGIPIELPRHRQLLEIPASPATGRMGRVLDRLTRAATDGEPIEPYSEPALAALAGILEANPPALRREPGSGLDSRGIVRACIDYVEAAGRIPITSELCAAAHVSERRLRSAFTEEFDLPPTVFFRTWALDRANRQLRDAGPRERSVTVVATDLGFDHFGRFAGYYRDVYGETPSETLRNIAS